MRCIVCKLPLKDGEQHTRDMDCINALRAHCGRLETALRIYANAGNWDHSLVDADRDHLERSVYEWCGPRHDDPWCLAEDALDGEQPAPAQER